MSWYARPTIAIPNMDALQTLQCSSVKSIDFSDGPGFGSYRCFGSPTILSARLYRGAADSELYPNSDSDVSIDSPVFDSDNESFLGSTTASLSFGLATVAISRSAPLKARSSGERSAVEPCRCLASLLSLPLHNQ